MHTLCHRCGGDLPSTDGPASFCPHCGAPQLYLRDHLLEDLAAEPATSTPPPHPRAIQWQPALRASIFVALVAPALFLLGAAFGPFSLLAVLWIVSASVIAVGLYHHQRPLAYLDGPTGARIGVTVGLLMSTALSLSLAVSGLIARFGIHSMTDFDKEMTDRFHQQLNVMATQAAQANPSTPIPPWLIDFFLSPEFRAGAGLASLAVFCAMVLVVSTVGGAFAGSMRTLPQPRTGQ